MKSNIVKGFLLVCTLAMLSSCVSKKKYEALQEEARQARFLAQEKQEMLQAQIEELLRKQGELRDSLTQAQARIAKLEQALRDTSRLYQDALADKQRLKAQSSAEIQDLIERLEVLRQDLYNRELRLRSLEEQLAARDSLLARVEERLKTKLRSFQAEGLSVQVKDGKVYVSLSDRLLFDRGKTDIDSEGEKALKELAEVLREEQDLGILVEGHTDSIPILRIPGIEDNWDLSVMRATEVIRFLIEEGELTPQRITASGRGEWAPIAPNSNKKGRARNRRTEIILVPDISEIFELIEPKE